MIQYKWHNSNSKIYGKSICGKYEVKVKPDNHSFEYTIKDIKQNQTINEGHLKVSDISEAIKIITSITSLKYAI